MEKVMREKEMINKFSLLRNPELKSALIIIVLIQLGLVLVFFLAENRFIESINGEITKQNISLVGRLTTLRNNMDKGVHSTQSSISVKAFVDVITKGATLQEYEAGADLLSKYGYKLDLSIHYQKVLQRVLTSHSFMLVILFLCSTFILICVTFIGYSRLYKKVSNIVLASERVLSDSFDVRLDEAGEGEFALLGCRFNQMVKKLEYTLESLKSEKTHLKNIISDISHQIKTPLSSLILFNELMLESDNKGSSKQINTNTATHFIYESKKQLERMEWLVISLLKMARLEVGAIEFNRARTPLIIPIKNTIQLLKHKTQEKQLEIQILSENDRDICANIDKEWFTEALINILKNCIEHTNENGLIEIELQETPLFSRIVIKDNGEGISKKDLPNVFKRFYKGENSVQPQSIGIGLALTKSIIEGNDGDIQVKSIRSEGTSFIITFHR